jgi:PIN domain nuclease of toxin-antitoxin system
MKIFLDTSSLFKLYHIEDGTDEIMDLIKNNSIEAIYLSEITKIEFDSVVWKKFRKQEVDETKVLKIIQNFERDSSRFSLIKDN